MSRPWKVALTLVLLLACGIGWFVFQLFGPSPPIVVSKESTYLTEPLADDGLPDYAGYLLEKGREGVTPENNAAVPLLLAMWPAGMDAEEQRAVCAELGMEVPSDEQTTIALSREELRELLSEWISEQRPAETATLNHAEETPAELDAQLFLEGEEELDDVRKLVKVLHHVPWKRSDCPPLAVWIDRHAAQFDLLHEGAGRPKFYCPSPLLLLDPTAPLLYDDASPRWVLIDAGHHMALRAQMHLGEGDHEAAWKDCKAIYSLAAVSRDGVTMFSIAAFRDVHLANLGVLNLLNSPGLNLQLAREIHSFLANYPDMERIVRAVDTSERLLFVTAVLSLSPRGRLYYTDAPEQLLGPHRHGVDWNAALRHGNQWYDKCVDAMTKTTWSERQSALDALDAYWDDIDSHATERSFRAMVDRSERNRVVADICLASLLPPVEAALLSEVSCNSRLQLHRVAAALAVYRVEQGDYPDSLDALVPDLLDAAPVDLYHQNPLVYRRTDQGYLLYSLGANGIDEGGSNQQHSVHEGYSINDDTDEAAVRELLGLPPASESPTAEEPLDEDDFDEEERISPPLSDDIPAGADDWSIRLPLPRVPFPSSN